MNPTPVAVLLWTAAAFLLGALPFSVWIGRFALGVDIRTVGDGNPGATNVLRAGSFPWFTVALMFDIAKGAAPVGVVAQLFGWTGWPIVLVAFAPTLGHAFSPFLGFNGGKAIASVGGAWIGIDLWRVFPAALVLLVLWWRLLDNDGWALIGTMVCLLLWLVFFFWRWEAGVLWGLQVALFVWKQRADLARLPALRRSGAA